MSQCLWLSAGITAITNIGLLLTASPINSDTFLLYTPQIQSPPNIFLTDTINWTKISASYSALGGEQYITIGNFKTTSNTDTLSIGPRDPFQRQIGYYFIDDVSVTLCDSGNTVHEYSKDAGFNLFPNPSDGNMQLKYSIKQSDKGAIKIYDVTGKLIEEIALDANSSQQKISTNLNTGIYFYQINVNDRIIKNDKIVIIK